MLRNNQAIIGFMQGSRGGTGGPDLWIITSSIAKYFLLHFKEFSVSKHRPHACKVNNLHNGFESIPFKLSKTLYEADP